MERGECKSRGLELNEYDTTSSLTVGRSMCVIFSGEKRKKDWIGLGEYSSALLLFFQRVDGERAPSQERVLEMR